MTPLETYLLYHALKLHFTSDNYDFFKYGGKTRLNSSTYDNSSDKAIFYRLSKKKDPKGIIISNLLINEKIYVRDLLTNDAERVYNKWLGVNQSLQYKYLSDLNLMNNDFDKNFIVIDNKYPIALSMYLREKINIETIIILDRLINMTKVWNKKISLFDDILWKSIYLRISKYSPFVVVDLEIYKDMTVKRFS